MPEPQRAPQPLDRKGKRLPKSDPNRNIKRLPRTNSFPLPMWLKVLIVTQKISITTTVLLACTVFAIYGWTVYAHDQWNQQYKKLELLKRQERQLTNAAGSFNNEMLQSIQNKPGDLVRESPSKSLFLEAAPLRPKREVPSTVSDADLSKPNESFGY